MNKQTSIDSGGTEEDSGDRSTRTMTVETDDEDYPNGTDNASSKMNGSIDTVRLLTVQIFMLVWFRIRHLLPSCLNWLHTSAQWANLPHLQSVTLVKFAPKCTQ
jgi:hypothetical protein